MRAWTVQHGDQQLAMHYRRSMRLGIDASPTLTRANSPLSLEPTAQRLTWEACHGPYEGAPACDSLPVCIDDRDCRRAGKLGRCVSDEGRPACVYRDAVRFECVVVGPGTEAGPDEQSIVAGTQELFPGVSITRVSFETRRGKKLVADAGVDALPLYLFGRAVEDAANFGRIRDDVRRVGKYYTFGDGVVPQTYFHRRPLQPGNVQVFIDPLFAAVDEVLREALGVQDSVAVHPVLYTNPSAPTGSAEERFRAEEAQRWLLLRKHFPEAYRTYLASYAKRPGSTYWTTSLAEAGVDIEDFTRIAEQDTSALDDAWRLLRELDIRTPVMMLVDNRHLMPVDNLRQLTRALNRRPRG